MKRHLITLFVVSLIGSHSAAFAANYEVSPRDTVGGTNATISKESISETVLVRAGDLYPPRDLKGYGYDADDLVSVTRFSNPAN